MRQSALFADWRGSLASRRGAIVCVAAAAIAVGLAGCEQKRASTPPLLPKPQHSPDTKLGKLELIVERLKEQLDSAQAAQGSGVESQRTCSYRLIPDDPNKAEITITTRAQLALEDAKEGSPPASAKGAGPKAKGAKKAGEPAAKKPNAENARPVLKKEVVVLAYENDAWKLLEQPKGQTEQLLFEYALNTSESAP